MTEILILLIIWSLIFLTSINVFFGVIGFVVIFFIVKISIYYKVYKENKK